MRLALALAPLVVAAGPAVAATVVHCTAPGQSPVTIALDSQRTMGRMLSCISGDFIEDMTPCAPSGAWSLSAPTGTAAIVGFANRWQEYQQHHGGVIGFNESAEKLRFEGFFREPPDTDTDPWSFSVDRLSGKAFLTQPAKPDVQFTCSKIEQKF